MTKILIKNGRIIDPANQKDEFADLLIIDGKIAQVQPDITCENADIIDAKDKVVCPGFIDMHVHLREPGGENKETIKTGTKAAAAGGFTAVASMPNTTPVTDNPETIQKILKKATQAGFAKVYPIAAITMGSQGEKIVDILQLIDTGAVAISDDGRPVMNSQIMRLAMEIAAKNNIPVISHSEDLNLAGFGVMNEGKISRKIGLTGIPSQAETVMIARDIQVAELTGAKIHIAHISTALGVKLVRLAKKRGIQISAEVTPHHFTLTDDFLETCDTNFKMNPPLRTKEDVEAIKEGIADGTLEVIASDHAPHTEQDKNASFDKAPFGIIGLETMVGLVITQLVKKNIITLNQAIEKLSLNPSKVLNLPGGTLSIGAEADVTILDIHKKWTVDPGEFHSKSKNTPFAGCQLTGKSVLTIIDGRKIQI